MKFGRLITYHMPLAIKKIKIETKSSS